MNDWIDYRTGAAHFRRSCPTMQNDAPVVPDDGERGERHALENDIEDADGPPESGHLPAALRRAPSHRQHLLRSGHQLGLAGRRGICKERLLLLNITIRQTYYCAFEPQETLPVSRTIGDGPNLTLSNLI